MTGGASAHGLPSTGEHVPLKAPPPEPAKTITAQGDERLDCTWPWELVLKYGDFAQAAYDTFDPRRGASLHGLRRLFPEHGLDGHGYVATAFLYANVDLVRRMKCDDRRYWIGYVAVARDAERDRDIGGYRDIVVVWRGTASSHEMLKDFEMSLVPIHGRAVETKPGAQLVHVERGFHSVYVASCESACQEHNGKLSAQSQVLGELTRLVEHLRARIPDEKIRVTVTGHSLGGALALLTAWDAAEVLTGVPVRAVTFGAPRVGNKAFCDELVTSRRVQVLRLVVNKDPVPEMPLESMGYAHAGEAVVLDADRSIPETKTWNFSRCNFFLMWLPWRFHKFDLYLLLLYGRDGVARPFRCNKNRCMPVAKVDMEMLLDRLEESELDRMISPTKEDMEKLMM